MPFQARVTIIEWTARRQNMSVIDYKALRLGLVPGANLTRADLTLRET